MTASSVPVHPHLTHDLLERARIEVDAGLVPAGQLAVARNGEIEVFEALGHATTADRFVVFSVTKAVMAALTWALIDDGVLAVDTRIAEVLPGFGGSGKHDVTVEHLLTHTSGFPNAPMGPPYWFDRRARLERMASWRLDHPPGTHVVYHPTSAHWALAETITEITGRDYREVVRARLLDPLGLDRIALGWPGDDRPENRWADVVELTETGSPPTPDEMEALTGVAIDMREVTNDILLRYNADEVRDLGVPGGGGIASAADIALLYQAMLHDPGDFWSPAILRAGTAEIRTGDLVDDMFGFAANRTLGLVLAGDDGKAAFRQSFGHTVSPRAFGHAGAGGQIAWADPESGLSFCFLSSGLDRHVIRMGRRSNALSSRAAALCS